MRTTCTSFFLRLAIRRCVSASRRGCSVIAAGAIISALCSAAPAQQPAAAPQTIQPGATTGVLPPPSSTVQSGTSSGVLPSPLIPVGQTSSASPYALQSLVTTPTLSPGALTLLELDGRFSQAVATGGGPAFVQWFAENAVTLNNGKPAIQGRSNIAATATWKPADYQLTWAPQGASMGPSQDMGYTWGSYEGRSRDAHGESVTTTGRYITIWQKQSDGQWKISLEASADDAPASGACCALPKP